MDVTEKVLFAGMILFTVLIIGALIYSHTSCEASGGRMEKTGDTYTTYTMVGKVLVPMIQEERECVK